jgi:hypothetical protein
VEVEELEIQIVVGESASGVEAGVPGEVHDLHTTLHGSAEGAADVLAQPTGVYFVVQRYGVHIHPPFFARVTRVYIGNYIIAKNPLGVKGVWEKISVPRDLSAFFPDLFRFSNKNYKIPLTNQLLCDIIRLLL